MSVKISEIMTRMGDKLYKAYTEVYGRPTFHKPGAALSVSPMLTEREARAVLAERVVTIPERELERYRRHGLASIPIDIRNSIIDTYILRDIKDPKYAWFGRFAPNALTLNVSSGKAKRPHKSAQGPHKAVEFDSERTLEGLVISFDFDFSHREIPYEVELLPLYGEWMPLYFNWGEIFFTQSDYPMTVSPPDIVFTPDSTPIVAFQNRRRDLDWGRGIDSSIPEYLTIVPGEYVGEDGPSYRTEDLQRDAVGPDNLGSKIIAVRPVPKSERAEVREALREGDFRGRVYFWK